MDRSFPPSPPLSAGTKTPPCELQNLHVLDVIDHSWWKLKECPACHHELCGPWLLMVVRYKESADRTLPVIFPNPPYGGTADISLPSYYKPYGSIMTSSRYNAQTGYVDVEMNDSSNTDSDATISEHDSDEDSYQDSIGLRNPQKVDTPEVIAPTTKTSKKRTGKKKPKASTTGSKKGKRSSKLAASASSTINRVEKDSQPVGTRRSQRISKTSARLAEVQNTEAEEETQSTGKRFTILYKDSEHPNHRAASTSNPTNATGEDVE